ncbi:MAG: TrbC/VirB2 family protein [Alphaproteobacteria bacterium]|nr:TrbC/VirB2 family protein [Alphaproteobacteria bacterium]
MQFMKKNIWTLVAMIFVVTVAMIGDACADDVMGLALTKTRNVFEKVKSIIFVLGGFGLVAVAFLAIFGKVNWKWFAGLAVGLAILAAANAVVQYSAGANAGLNDTFQQTSSM